MSEIRRSTAGVHHVCAAPHDQCCGKRGGGGHVVFVSGRASMEIGVHARQRGEYGRCGGMRTIDGAAETLAAQTALAFGPEARKQRALYRHAVNAAEPARHGQEPRARAQLHRQARCAIAAYRYVHSSTVRTIIRVVPTSTASPSRTSIASVTRLPLRRVPLRLPRSST